MIFNITKFLAFTLTVFLTISDSQYGSDGKRQKVAYLEYKNASCI